MTPNWDIHPEMVSHTWVIDTKTGRPFPERTADFMENWGWSAGKSADQLAEYIGVCTPDPQERGAQVRRRSPRRAASATARLPELARGTLDACRDVFSAEIPHYFRHLFTDDRSVAPRVELRLGPGGRGPEVRGVDHRLHWGLVRRLGWAHRRLGRPVHHRRPQGGRLPEVIARGEPAVMVCHWPGMYFNGQETGFKIFRGNRRAPARGLRPPCLAEAERDRAVLGRARARPDRAPSRAAGSRLRPRSPAPSSRVKVQAGREKEAPATRLRLTAGENRTAARGGGFDARAQAGDVLPRSNSGLVACFDLPKGTSRLEPGGE